MNTSSASGQSPASALQTKMKGLQYNLFTSTFSNLKVLKQQQVLLDVVYQLFESLESQKKQNDKTESIDQQYREQKREFQLQQ